MANFNKPYNPGIAEQGKFVEIVAPSNTTYGKYAIITYDAGGMNSTGDVLGTSANPIFTNMVSIVSSVEVSVSGIQLSEIVSAVNCIVSTQEINPLTSISAYQAGEWTVNTIPPLYRTIQASSINVDTNPTSVIFDPAVQIIDIANNSNDTVYFWLDNTSTIPGNDLSAIGMPLESGSFYSTTGLISCVAVVSNGVGSNVRVIGRKN